MRDRNLEPIQYDYCERHDTVYDANKGCEGCKDEWEDSLIDQVMEDK